MTAVASLHRRDLANPASPARQHFSDQRLKDVQVPAYVVTTDLASRPHVISSGPIVRPRWPVQRSRAASEADRRVVYERVLCEAADAEELGRYVNGKILVEVWPRLWLPERVRQAWEQRFPELTHAA